MGYNLIKFLLESSRFISQTPNYYRVDPFVSLPTLKNLISNYFMDGWNGG